MFHKRINTSELAFTLIEISVVLIIVALIAGGVLVGRNLVSASAVRSQITQIEKFNAAALTFRTKYNYLPGDVPDPLASSAGLVARGAYAGQGDGNGVLEGNTSSANGGNLGSFNACCETALFWRDLSQEHLIDGSFTTATATSVNALVAHDKIMPRSKLMDSLGNKKNVVSVWSYAGNNYFSIYASSLILAGMVGGGVVSTSVEQASAIDAKMDDGFPQSGRVLAAMLAIVANGGFLWADSTYSDPAPTTAVAGSSTTCFDNGNVAGPRVYSITQSGGTGLNCALAFRFQ